MINPTKKEIVTRLLESKAITFDEALLLLEVEYKYIYQELLPVIQPYIPPYNPYQIYYSTSTGSNLNTNFTDK